MTDTNANPVNIQKPAPTPLSKILGSQQAVSGVTQPNLNTPLVDPTGVSDIDKAFLADVMSKMQSGQIQPYQPSSVINAVAYEKLDQFQKGKADLNALILLSRIRQIKDLYDQGYADTYQIQNMVNSCRLLKERIEKECGDCFII